MFDLFEKLFWSYGVCGHVGRHISHYCLSPTHHDHRRDNYFIDLHDIFLDVF